MGIIEKARFYFTFFKSTLALSIAIGVAVGFIYVWKANEGEVLNVAYFSMTLSALLRCCCLVGFPICLLYKERTRKYEYYFYQNAGISKINLIAVTFGLYAFCSVLVFILSYIVWNSMS